jgi:hypothetical protein
MTPLETIRAINAACDKAHLIFLLIRRKRQRQLIADAHGRALGRHIGKGKVAEYADRKIA